MDVNNNRLRDDVEAVLFSARRQSVSDESAILGNNVFSVYCDANIIGQKIFDDLWEKRGTFIYGNQERKSFYSDDRNTSRMGYLSDVYGCSAVFALMNRMVSKVRTITKRGRKTVIDWNETSIVLTEAQQEEFLTHIYAVLDDIDRYGYNLFPYISGKLNDKLFPKSRPYMGAITWTLSLLVNAWRAHVKKLIKLSDARYRQIRRYIKEIIIENIIDSVVTDSLDKTVGIDRNSETGETILTQCSPYGWGYTKGCLSPSLYFTYSVLEAYSDFDDLVLSVIDRSLADEEKSDYQRAAEELVSYIDEGENPGKVEKWRLMCETISDRVWDDYKDVLKTAFVDDAFYEFEQVKNPDGNITLALDKTFGIIDKDTILKSNSSNALFNNIYIIFILFYGYVNKRKWRTEEEVEDIVSTMNITLRNVQKMYNELCKEGRGYLVDSYIVNFKQLHIVDGDKYMRMLSSERLLDSTIVPMLVKANNMIAFHIEKYPIKEMRDLFLDLFKEMDKSAWLWDGSRYDVKITERYIEAIADFYDYYNEYEKTYADFDSQKLSAVNDTRKEYEARISDIDAKHKAEIEKKDAELAAVRNNVATEYAVETAMRVLIDKYVSKMLGDALKNIKKYNSGKIDKSALSGFEEQLCNLIPELFLSYLGRKIFERKIVDGEEDRKEVDEKIDKFYTDLRDALDQLLDAIDNNVNSVSNFIATEFFDNND